MRQLMMAVCVAAAMAAAACGSDSPTMPAAAANCPVPGNITNLSTTISGTTVTFNWTPNTTSGATPTDYVLSIGTSTGASNAATVTVTGTTTYAWTGVAAGTYYARVQPRNACGVGASNEVNFVMPAR